VLGQQRRGLDLARDIGYRLLKAAAAAAARIRVIHSPRASPALRDRAQRAVPRSASDLYLEKYLVSPRHIEIQSMGHRFGK